MIRREDHITFADKLATLVEAEELKYALLKGEVAVRCDHTKRRFWFSKCPDHLWDSALREICNATGYKPVDEE